MENNIYLFEGGEREMKIVTKQILEDKLEGLHMARQTTTDKELIRELDNVIADYEHQYEDFTGRRYNNEKDTR